MSEPVGRGEEPGLPDWPVQYVVTSGLSEIRSVPPPVESRSGVRRPKLERVTGPVKAGPVALWVISDEASAPEASAPPSSRWHRYEAAAVFLFSFLLAAFVIKEKSGVEAYLSRIGPVAYPLAILIFAVVAAAPFSVTDALAIMNGVIFGPWRGSIVNALGLVIAAVGGYAIARRTSHLLQIQSNVERLPSWVRRFRVGSPPFLLTLRLVPGLGGTLATQIAAALRVPMFVHVWTMCAVAVPVCTLLAIFGDRVAATVHDYYEAHAPHVHIHMHVHIPRSLDIFHRHHRSRSHP